MLTNADFVLPLNFFFFRETLSCKREFMVTLNLVLNLIKISLVLCSQSNLKCSDITQKQKCLPLPNHFFLSNYLPEPFLFFVLFSFNCE